jgi:hypothetical protein
MTPSSSGSRTKTIAIVLVAVLAAAALGYWGYGAYKTRELRAAVGTILKEAAGHMRDALAVQGGQLPEDRAAPAKKLDGQVAAVDKGMARLKRVQAHRDRGLTDNADGYLVSAREILRAQARMYRAYQRHAQSLDSLRDHMRVDDRRGAWVKMAVRAKERAERDFRDYRLANASYATLLGSFPTTQKKVETAIGSEGLATQDQIDRARAQALAIANEAAEEMEKVRQLVGPK